MPPPADLAGCSLEDLEAAIRHMEDLDVFVGQRSRMHPGPGWATALEMVRRDLALLRTELDVRATRPPVQSGPSIGKRPRFPG